jgi:hypothetical protein
MTYRVAMATSLTGRAGMENFKGQTAMEVAKFLRSYKNSSAYPIDPAPSKQRLHTQCCR